MLITKTEEVIVQEIVQDIMMGISDTGVQAGIIGETGCFTLLEEGE